MLENLCINLINELFLTKYNFLTFIILNDLKKNGITCKKVKKKKIRIKNEEKNEPIIHKYINIFKKDYYLKFFNVKEKKIKRKRKIRVIFKKLRKNIININESYNRYNNKKIDLNSVNEHNYNRFIISNTLLLHFFEIDLILKKKDYRIIKKIASRNKKKSVKNFKKKNLYKLKEKSNFPYFCNKKEYEKFLNHNLHEYIYKDFYNFLSNYDFKKEVNENKKNMNCIFNKKKVDKILKKKKDIVKKVCIKNKTYMLSSKKLKKSYIEFIQKFHFFLDKLKVDRKEDTKQFIDDCKVLKTLLYLKNVKISKNLGDSSLIKSTNYKLYEAISMINYLKKGLYIIKMDIMYIYIFFSSYINNIFTKLKKLY